MNVHSKLKILVLEKLQIKIKFKQKKVLIDLLRHVLA